MVRVALGGISHETNTFATAALGLPSRGRWSHISVRKAPLSIYFKFIAILHICNIC